MKVAIVHDYIKEYGGAERVLEALYEAFPDSTVFTSLYYPKFLGPHEERFKKMKVKTSWFQFIPFGYKLISPLRLLSPFAFKCFDFKGYDVIIVSQTGAYFPNLVKKRSAKLFCYTHTPPRYLYGYKTAREWKNNILFRVLGELANHILRMVDFVASKNVDQFIANSEEVKARIEKFYRRDAVVIYPPVEAVVSNSASRVKLEKNKLNADKLDAKRYYLAGGRLARAKGMGVIIDAFNLNKKPLKVFGKAFAGYGEELKAKSGKHTEFLGEVTDEEKLDLMSNAKAFVFASYDEDFGITPVEAMGQGTPVIAYKSGGVKETVIDGKTGVFFEDNTPEALNDAIDRFEKMRIESSDCQKQAQKFSKVQFIKQIQNLIK